MKKNNSNFPEDQDDETLTIRGSDVDYVRANIHCATSIGRARRKEVEAAQEAAAEKRKKKSEQMKPSEKYKTGSVPKVRNNQFSMNYLAWERQGLFQTSFKIVFLNSHWFWPKPVSCHF